MKVVTSSQMRKLDEITINSGIPGLELMERAGTGVANVIIGLYESLKRVLVVCGKGNNGGDGMVVARILAGLNYPVKLILLCDKNDLKGDAKTNFDKLNKDLIEIIQLQNENEILRKYLSESEIIVDAILGTGIKGNVDNFTGWVINEINNSKVNDSSKKIISVDIPSGVIGDTGEIAGACVFADMTVTMGLPKIGHLFFPGRQYTGELFVVDIGIPEKAIEESESFCSTLSLDEAIKLLPERSPVSHKGSCGRVLTVGGRKGYTGAVAMCSNSALKVGAGLSYLIIPESLNDILETKLTEVITIPVCENKNQRCLVLRSKGDILRWVNQCDAVAIGPGIGTFYDTVELVIRLVKEISKPLIIDADALNCISKNDNPFNLSSNENIIYTPHPGEMSRLVKCSIDEIILNPLLWLYSKWKEGIFKNGIVILKGAPTLALNTKTGEIFINPKGNPGMATAGSGDVLSGCILGFLAQGLNIWDATRLGVYVHSFAGDLAQSDKGVLGMIASDIEFYLPFAIKKLYSYSHNKKNLKSFVIFNP